MGENFSAPFLSRTQINQIAKEFSKNHNPENNIPFPLETTIEFNLSIAIVPIPKLLNRYNIDGFLLSNLEEIWVDRHMYEKRSPRYNFTLAHELGHYVLHREVYENSEIKSTDEWKGFQDNLSEKELSWFEWQASEFAGLILVPTNELKIKTAKIIDSIQELDIKDNTLVVDQLLESLAKRFFVSRTVIKKRLEREEGILSDSLQEELLSF